MKKLVIDLDGTLTTANTTDYRLVSPNKDVIKKLREYQQQGFSITIFTARNMRTYEGNIGKINIHTLPIIVEWLDKHSVPYDEIIVGKPWCGHEGFYIDDRAIRPSEFASLSADEINDLLDKEKIKCS
ncbi:capsular biosynthesis protein [Photobacterium phosphoreum]|uniref:HAD-IIIC family phosphatase n=1 Tax=Photobacterium phosphoreum TaxID=659 RepID=UPI000D157524|nr:HAD-IIIC family phosphatase [Photobacterium phosphoreum]PSU81860.1 capsular biosynthesis protein [Photobacterium phosphoreum]PSW32998.1 capsular biosynthesis protein [Photobacterium phosphoreum]